ncbi:ester cyclase [Actinomadura macrotermitis]|uniref:Ester cyclase n=1 Tax=Actinomadura macrotermitis TaxID=2585200 RepID=A0A7K0BXR9_9ACTN|nr:ester cyclase [Actinomadura macrotermitis]MQY05981.1 hypothetical protein [Actinomadura macrotermitis]
MSDRIADMYRRWLGELWQGDLPVIEELCAPGLLSHWAGEEVQGRDAAAARIARTFTLFDDVSTELIAGPVVDGGTVAAHWSFFGAYRGGLPGTTAAPGTKVAFTGTDILRAEDGRFVEYWVVSDVLGMMTRLGAAFA